jgi:hypothetical protein
MEHNPIKLKIQKRTFSNGREPIYWLIMDNTIIKYGIDYKEIKKSYDATVKCYDKTYIQPVTSVDEIIEETLIEA